MRIPRDAVAAVILIGIGLWYGLEAQGFRPGSTGDPGPSMFPTLLSGALIALSLWLIVQSLRKARAAAAADAASQGSAPASPASGAGAAEQPADRSGLPGIARALAAIALTAGFILAFTPLGYIISVGLYAALLSLLFRRDSLIVPLVTAAVAVGGIHLLFAVFLGVRLPMGVL